MSGGPEPSDLLYQLRRLREPGRGDAEDDDQPLAIEVVLGLRTGVPRATVRRDLLQAASDAELLEAHRLTVLQPGDPDRADVLTEVVRRGLAA